uniref:Uncharacterized protein n=1 Tax=Bombyx mori TaxID=7091 RepID=A0A8R2M0V4_BOMMO|nr:cingulin isoform X5 [Bombyx mori]
MMKTMAPLPIIDKENAPQKRVQRLPIAKRAQSASPAVRPRNPVLGKKPDQRRCQSLSPLSPTRKRFTPEVLERPFTQGSVSAPEAARPLDNYSLEHLQADKEVVMPQCVLSKIMRTLATKKREFIKMRKNLIAQQNSLLEHYAILRDMESRAGVAAETLGEVRVLSVSGWPAHDLLLLVRDDLEMPMNSEINGVFGTHVLQQLMAQLNPIPEEVLGMGAELMARRLELLNFLRGKHRSDRATFSTVLNEELSKERAAREALKEVVASAESMLRVARARIATLERQLKDTKAEFEIAKKKHKDLEQLVNRLAIERSHATYRHRENSYDARSKKLLEVSKTGEITIETLSRQRDALELRVKELREQAETAEQVAQSRVSEQKARTEFLQAKVAEQEKSKAVAESKVVELEGKVKELESQLQSFRDRSIRLVDMERRRCLEYVPCKENEPTDRETEIWKELQMTRGALLRSEEELRQSRAEKDSFLNSLSRIAQGEGTESFQDKMATELLDREQKIVKLQQTIDEQRENEKSMEQTMTQYENQLAALRLEVKRLRNYDCYSKDVSYPELQTEILDLHLQVETLSRERTALITAAASRALMLERHERAADLFARMVRARKDLAALLDGRIDPPPFEDIAHAEMSRSLTSVCATAADTWTALRAERARVLRLESAVLAQSLQLEREGLVRTQLERRKAILERELLRANHSTSANSVVMCGNPSLDSDFFGNKQRKY